MYEKPIDKLMDAAYDLTLKFCMDNIGREFLKRNQNAKIKLIHDQSPYDSLLQKTFESMLKDTNFNFRDCFVELVPASSENTIPLQLAGLVAFEMFKEAKRQFDQPQHPVRKSFDSLLNMTSFGIRMAALPKDLLIKMRDHRIQRETEEHRQVHFTEVASPEIPGNLT